MSNVILQLQQWYEAQCNGDWEHHYGISIESQDNPGWRVEIDLKDTPLCGGFVHPHTGKVPKR